MGTSSKDKRDIYYKKAKEENYRARSAYKLLHIDETFKIFNNDTKKIVDLCAAPGSWSQICVKKISELNNEGIVVAVDLLKMANLREYEGDSNILKLLEEDITSFECPQKIFSLLGGSNADMVLCDGAPDITGITDLDEYYQNQLILSALNISLKVFRYEETIKNNETFVCKCFRGRDTFILIRHIKQFFESVILVKPIASRNVSIESFILARTLKKDFRNFDPFIVNYSMDINTNNVIKVYSCGSGSDPDLITENYNPTIEHKYPPINPAYKKIVDKRKNN